MEKTTKRGKKEKKHATKEIEIIRKEKNRQEGKKIAGKNEIVNHPSLDTPQKKNQKTHLGDPKIYQVEGMDIPKQEVAKFS